MPRKGTLLNSLARGRIRASFNKFNLFNLYKKGQVNFRNKNLYQQKWTAKQETRSYHGEHIREGRWQSMFQSKLDSVAQLDASLRGSAVQETPFLLQTYSVLEKRLDFALFRSMFASSIRQARQFIIHGNVYVNGTKVKHPGYTLKPGDMFNVKPEMVLKALGYKKPSLLEGLKIDKIQIASWNNYVDRAKKNPRLVWETKIKKWKELPDSDPEKQKFLSMLKEYRKNIETEELSEVKTCTPETILSKILEVQAQSNKELESLTENDFKSVVKRDGKLATKVFSCFQEFSKSGLIKNDEIKGKKATELKTLVSELMSPSADAKKDMTDSAKLSIRSGKKHLTEITKSYTTSVRDSYQLKKEDLNSDTLPYDEKWVESLSLHKPINPVELGENELKARRAINLPEQKHVYGRKNPNKPYFTPWKPRPFLAPFAILPHHIEVSFKTCHAVYLRDPVARPGHSEVISPYGLPVHQKAYMYYVRSGK
ncbi:hypothetical protein Kpol_505p29 [Vanderwaltozyma polyspora DSM 70294]|uniref:Small ribosomal subunit protein uS4m n=1 Tax=Vanderwaltozyma polyspora (strain ATCC 22028 / DSM 70294 / BCRC 21397 / CBS 2163 / NBRC 10782 / NRRL Y-8283 / UCD 57-17) TaxID=436907 RepID=A7TNC0_VANPO|nr:uncharacterized protein Kpol_505p29 [Vanderwaltozyma polyspora DSM 70294]EDO16252.1 hypothetical protein Kpol_505p29 [Vanderwaltozyma polyspora DSM 70294]